MTIEKISGCMGSGTCVETCPPMVSLLQMRSIRPPPSLLIITIKTSWRRY